VLASIALAHCGPKLELTAERFDCSSKGVCLDAGSPDAAASSHPAPALFWRERTPSSGTIPITGDFECLGFDPVRMVSVLASGGTYEWSGAAWQQVSPNGQCQAESMLYDKQRSELVQPGYATWIWAGGTRTWSTLALPGPLRLATNVAIRQDAHQRFLLQTGLVFNSTVPSQTWALNYELTDFTLLTSGGPPRVEHSMAYDAGRDQVILFGGIDNANYDPCEGVVDGNIYCGSTWLFDSSGWRQLNPDHLPPSRGFASMIYDEGHQRIIMFGGENDVGVLNDTWAWDGTDWTPISSPQSPAPRTSAPITYDPVRDQVVLFGGNDGRHWFTDLWELGP
jgi:hypothetical protein